VGQRKHLEAARIGEDRAIPADEPVQAAETPNDIQARPQEQVGLALIAKAATLTLSVVLLNVLSLRYGLANPRLHKTSSAAKAAL
jgi:hypothetical protein